MTIALTLFACLFVGANLFVFALGKAAKRGDQFSDEPNPFKDLKGETTAKARGGNDAAPQLNRCAFLTAGQLSGLTLQ